MQLPQDTDPRRFNLCKFDINRLPLLYRIYNMYINSIFDKNRLPLLDRIYNICILYIYSVFDINRLPLLDRIYNIYIYSVFDINRLPLLYRIYNIYTVYFPLFLGWCKNRKEGCALLIHQTQSGHVATFCAGLPENARLLAASSFFSTADD